MAYGFKNNASNKIISYTDTGTGSIKSTTLNTGSNIDTSKLIPDSAGINEVVNLDSMVTSNSAKVDYGSGPSTDVSGAKSTGYAQTGKVDYVASKVQTDEVALDKKLSRDEARINPDFKGQASSSTVGDYKSNNGANGGSPNAGTATPTAVGMAPPATVGGIGASTPGTTNMSASYGASNTGVSYDVPDTSEGASNGLAARDSDNVGYMEDAIYDTTKMTLTPDGTLRVEGVDFSKLTEEDLQALIGSMSQEEYDTFIAGIEAYYNKQLEYFESVLGGEEGLDAQLKAVNQVVKNIDIAANANSQYGAHEDPKTLATRVFKSQLESVGVNSYEELIALQQELSGKVNYLNEAIKTTKNVKDSAKYDYLRYLKQYNDYEYHEYTQEDLDNLEADSDYYNPADHPFITAFSSMGNPTIYSPDTDSNAPSYSYTKYHEKHPDVSPVEFMQMIEAKHPGGYYRIIGISNMDDLRTLVEVADKVPEMAKTFSYLFEADPEKAQQYLKDCKYEINNIKGQLEAKRFLDLLAEKDGEDGAWEFLCNELGVHGEGLVDGIDTFMMGLYHAGEAGYTGIQEFLASVGWYDGEIYENRTMDVSEYKKMYILQALMSKADKQELGLINEDGSLADPNSIIDFSKEYTGKFLSNNYEISQGIGNMLPSVMLSMVNPALGSTVMGISAGGNAYHGAMVDGHSYVSALCYGIFTGASEAITERIFGGLPGLSDVQVTGLKTYLQAMAKEGNQEMLQGVMDAVYQHAFMGQPLPTTPEEWKAFALDIGKQGLYGAITAGYMQVPSLVSSTININRFNRYMEAHNVSKADQAAAIDAIRNSDPKLANMTDEQIIINFASNVAGQVDLQRIQKSFGCNAETAFAILQNHLTGMDAVKLAALVSSGVSLEDALAKINTDADATIDHGKLSDDAGGSGSPTPESPSDSPDVRDPEFKDDASNGIEDVEEREDTPEIEEKKLHDDANEEVQQREITDISEATNPVEVYQLLKKGNISFKEALEYITTGVESGKLSKGDAQTFFGEFVGTDLASWSLKADTSYELLVNLLSACDKSGLEFKQIEKSLNVMQAMEDYYLEAANLDLESGDKIFETYRTHGIVHVIDVLTESINAYTVMKGANAKGLDLDTIMLSAVMHDTGMSGGRQLFLSVDADGKIVIKTDKVQSNGGNYRESHSFNSGVNIIAEAEALMKAGYTDTQVAEAALLAFAHSKSNSGLNPLANNPAGWSFAIQALQEANLAISAENNSTPFDFLGALKKAGIIKNAETSLSNTKVEVKCPKVYDVAGDGHLLKLDIKDVLTDGAGNYYTIGKDGKTHIPVENLSQHIVHVDEAGNFYRIDEFNNKVYLESDGKPVVVDGAGGKKKGLVETFDFVDGKLDTLSYEALAVRIGDALTNNDHALVNQYFGEITFKSTDYSHQLDASQVLEAMMKKFEKAVASKDIDNIPKSESIIRALLDMNDGLQDAAFAETRDVTYEVNGDTRSDSQPFVLGENNQVYKVREGPNGSVDVVITVKDSDHVPFCTLFAIQERAGELLSLSKTSNPLKINLVIEIDADTPADIRSLYQQYVDSYGDNKVVNFKLVNKSVSGTDIDSILSSLSDPNLHLRVGDLSNEQVNILLEANEIKFEDLSPKQALEVMNNPSFDFKISDLTPQQCTALLKSGDIKFDINSFTAAQVSEASKLGVLSVQETYDFVTQNSSITQADINNMFIDLVGVELASWVPNTDINQELYIGLLKACKGANINLDQLGKSLEVMRAMEDYYLDAANLELQADTDVFETYRTHGIVHVMDVLTESINAYTAIRDAGFKQLNLDTIMLSAVMHDTGMSGGKQIVLTKDSSGRLVIETIPVQSTGTNYRESHSFNSGVNIIENFKALQSLGYSNPQIAEAALLAFAHSKSNSGLNPLANNPAGWSFAIQALQEATKDCDFKIVDELIAAGIIGEEGKTTLSKNDVPVKCPVKYAEEDGVLVKDGEKLISNGGGKLSGKVDTYTFPSGVIGKLSYEALALRIGDAITNNDHAKFNQYLGDITFDKTDYSHQYSAQQVLDALLSSKSLSADAEGTLPVKETMVRAILDQDKLIAAATTETKHTSFEDSVIYEVDGVKYNKSQPFVLGENNQTYSVSASPKGGIDLVIHVRNSEAVPFCTLFAIEERAAEVESLSKISNKLKVHVKIVVDPNASTVGLYEQYATTKNGGESKVVDYEIVSKDK